MRAGGAAEVTPAKISRRSTKITEFRHADRRSLSGLMTIAPCWLPLWRRPESSRARLSWLKLDHLSDAIFPFLSVGLLRLPTRVAWQRRVRSLDRRHDVVLARCVDVRVLRVFRNIFNTDTGLSRFGRTAVAGAGGGTAAITCWNDGSIVTP